MRGSIPTAIWLMAAVVSILFVVYLLYTYWSQVAPVVAKSVPKDIGDLIHA